MGNHEIPKIYDHKKVEDVIYKQWEQGGFFRPEQGSPSTSSGSLKVKKYFSIVLPPPNVTGTLHLGHAVMLALEDLMARYHRMKGDDTVWIPGTDHAAIATQNVVEKKLLKEKGKTRHDLGREKFLQEVAKFVKESQNTIKNQTRKMGASLDWSRETYTMDEARSEAVKRVFVRMYNDGLIYRGYRIVNWCPRCHSTLADDEVEYKELKGKLYWIKYGPFILATARPETKLGDTCVAVHPDDKRYKKYVGQRLMIPGVLGEFEVTVVADKAVDMDFGSGVIKVTPAHDFIDYDIAKRHGITVKQVINEDGKMMDNCGKYAGLTTTECREEIVKDMQKMGFIEKIEEDYDHNLSVCYRCGTTVEPMPSKQWFVDVNKKVTIKGNKLFQNKSLKEAAEQVVRDKSITIIPERFEKIYFHWMENLRDWCVSRQIWFGHRIPVWYRRKKGRKLPIADFRLPIEDDTDNDEIYVGLEAPQDDGSAFAAKQPASRAAKADEWVQDPDTLDTWFSSGLWTFSTLLDKNFEKYKSLEEWLENSPDFKRFHPTTVLETGADILFFWVARMILLTTYNVGEVPFKYVYLHGLVRDKDGQKMSKSRPETALDPLDMIEAFGADALRLSMIAGNAPGNDFRLYKEKIEGYRNFVNKMWNVARYIMMAIETRHAASPQGGKIKTQTLADKWILEQLENLKYRVNNHMENYSFSLAAEELREFTWSKFADWYLEISKIEENKEEILLYVLETLLKLWHPFMPFVTEEIWQKMGKNGMLIVAEWPKDQARLPRYRKASGQGCSNLTQVNVDFEMIIGIISGIRARKNEQKIPVSRKVDVIISAGDKYEVVDENQEIIKKLARLGELRIEKRAEKPASWIEFKHVVSVYVNLGVDLDEQKQKNPSASLRAGKKAIEQLEAYLKSLENKLSNQEFLNKAPAAVVEKERGKLAEAKEKLAGLMKFTTPQ